MSEERMVREEWPIPARPETERERDYRERLMQISRKAFSVEPTEAKSDEETKTPKPKFPEDPAEWTLFDKVRAERGDQYAKKLHELAMKRLRSP